MGICYAELQATSHFSFLRGASSCEELFAQAAVSGIKAVAVVDRNSLAGVVRAHESAKTTGVRLVVGCRLDLVDGMSMLVYPTERPIPDSAAFCLSARSGPGKPNACCIGTISPVTPTA
jgi:error-prone DNA polymerase